MQILKSLVIPATSRHLCSISEILLEVMIKLNKETTQILMYSPYNHLIMTEILLVGQ